MYYLFFVLTIFFRAVDNTSPKCNNLRVNPVCYFTKVKTRFSGMWISVNKIFYDLRIIFKTLSTTKSIKVSDFQVFF